MEDLNRKLTTLIEYMEGVDYTKILKNSVILLSISIVHFFGFIYFAFNSIPPFVDFKSFSSLVFVAAGFLAVSSLLSRITSIAFTRTLIPYVSILLVFIRQSKHTNLRIKRRKKNGFIAPSEDDFRQRFLSRNLNRNEVIYEKSLEVPERKYEAIVRYSLLVLIFSFLYLGWQIAFICLVTVILFSLALFFVYSFLLAVLKSVSERAAIIISEEKKKTARLSFRESLRHISLFTLSIFTRNLFTIEGGRLRAETKFFKSFASANISLILVVSALIFGAGRSAHILGTESFDIATAGDKSVQFLSTSIVIVTSNGILGTSGQDGSMLFVPFDAAPVVEPNENIQPGPYIESLKRILLY